MLSGPTTVHFYSRETRHPQGGKENYSAAELDKDVEVWGCARSGTGERRHSCLLQGLLPLPPRWPEGLLA